MIPLKKIQKPIGGIRCEKIELFITNHENIKYKF